MLMTPLIKPDKPYLQINNILNALTPKMKILSGKEKLHFTNPTGELNVFILLEGTVTVCRSDDHLLVAYVNAPAVLGLQGSRLCREIYYYKLSSRSQVSYLQRTEALDVIDQQRLWHDVLTYQSFFSDSQCYREMILINRTCYESVCLLLFELMTFSEKERKSISVINYIWHRTHFSRSGIMKILAELRTGEYIITHNGKLVDICKKLPANY